MKRENIIDVLRSFCNEPCDCGKRHYFCVDEIIVEKGAIGRVAEVIARYHAKKVFVLADRHTYEAAGKRICEVLASNHIETVLHIFEQETVEPDEYTVGSAIMHYDPSCQFILGIGSGVINDIGKIVSNVAQKPYLIFGTAPSMDGYASATSSMSVGGLKVSLPSKQPNVIMADTEILAAAPMELLQAGIGDMLAKYVAICEWRIAKLIVDEYYCDRVARLVTSCLEKCVSNLDGLLAREEEAVANVFEGLVVCGIGMSLAGCSRPASGVEHYFSHIWDMRGLAKGTPVALHGIQCAVGTRLAIQRFERIKALLPDRERALRAAAEFDFSVWSEKLRDFIGEGAESMIAQEEREGKYDRARHAARLERILSHWNEILELIDTLPREEEIVTLLERLGAPKSAQEIGIDPATVPMTFMATKDIRDKYVLSRLYWDLGVLNEHA